MLIDEHIFKYAITGIQFDNKKKITRSLYMILEKQNKDNKYLVKY